MLPVSVIVCAVQRFTAAAARWFRLHVALHVVVLWIALAIPEREMTPAGDSLLERISNHHVSVKHLSAVFLFDLDVAMPEET